MPSLRFAFVVSLLATLVCLPGVAQKPKKTRVAAVPAQVAKPVAPPVELLPSQKPSVPPEVSYKNGSLTIVAENSTLGDILRAVHVQTGAAIDVPSNATERVASRLGPGPARDVLASLLHGSHFDYVIMGTSDNPNAVARVVLMTRTQGAESSAVSQPVQEAAVPTPAPPAMAEQGNDVSEQQDQVFDNGQEEPTPQPEGQAEGQPQQPPQPGAPGIKTPEQLLQELRQQQTVQQAPPETQPPPPEQ
jgi:hypothetical protein